MQKTLAVINLENIKHNALKIKSALNGKRLYAVIKADAYGHGAVRVAHCLQPYVYGFCVAMVEEGIALRVAGVCSPILVLTPPRDGYDVARARAYSLTVTVNSRDCARMARGCRCEIKLNTGMNRYGCPPEELEAVLKELRGSFTDGIYSHLYAAEDGEASLRQLEILQSARRYGLPLHISASGGFLRGGEYLADGVRCGILLYGYAPRGFSAEGYKKSLKIYARRIQTVQSPQGGAGYAPLPHKVKSLSAYRLGYADGFSRIFPLGVNNLCMDAFVSEKSEDLLCVMDDAQSYAERLGTIPYEVLVNCSRRAEKTYIGG